MRHLYYNHRDMQRRNMRVIATLFSILSLVGVFTVLYTIEADLDADWNLLACGLTAISFTVATFAIHMAGE